ncbi:MAG: hypothetical protein PHN78_02945 [Dehalococcoidales bacterium]|nr:hypothetical protein [Dehalococcoidales bacterium]
MAPLQKRALLSLLIGLVFTAAVIVVFLLEGDVTAFNRDETLRWITYAALVGVPLTYLILIDLTLRKPTDLDERDRLIMLRSGRIQWLAVIFSLVAWMITLTEIYQEERVVPVVFLTLIMISTLIISILAQSVGILLGYWSMDRNG